MSAQAYFVFGPGEGQRHEARGSVMHFKATAQTTNGRLSLMERTLPAGGRMPPPHAHTGNEEAFFVLEGQVTFVLNGSQQTLGPEMFLLVPARGPGTRSATSRQSNAAFSFCTCPPPTHISPSWRPYGTVRRFPPWRRSGLS